MPGFFKFVQRLATGKPIYDPGDIRPGAPQPQAESRAAEIPVRKHQIGTFPVVKIHKIITHINGNDMDVACEIVNESEMRVMLSRLRILGREIRMSDDLRPDQSHEYRIYRGPLLKNRGDDIAVLQYCTADSRDYFEATHTVTYMFHPNQNAYTIDEIRLRPPIRDIYG